MCDVGFTAVLTPREKGEAARRLAPIHSYHYDPSYHTNETMAQCTQDTNKGTEFGRLDTYIALYRSMLFDEEKALYTCRAKKERKRERENN